MKRYFKDVILQHREFDIIQFIEKNPFCTKDQLYSKGKIPKSKLTNELIGKLISQKKVKTTSMKKKRFFVGEIDFLTRLESLVKDYANESKDKVRLSLNKMVTDFLKYRVKVLRAEQKFSEKLNLRDTMMTLELISNHHKKPTLSNASIVFSITAIGIMKDRYYLSHQLKSQPKNTKQIFQKRKTQNSRRSLPELFEMRDKGRNEFGLTKKDFEKI